MESMRPKLIYLTARHPSLGPEAFVPRWRSHGALGMSLPRWRNIARYVHCDVLRSGAANAALDAGYDGVGLIWHRSPEARRAHLADTSSRAQMESDESRTFARPIAEVCVVTAETLFDPPRGRPGDAKLFRFAWAASPSDAAALRADALRGASRALLLARGATVTGHAVSLPLAPERGDRWGLDVAVVEELWFDSPADAAAAAPVLRGAARGAPAGREVYVVTNEVLLYEIDEGSADDAP